MFVRQFFKAFLQTHILNLPIGLNRPEGARDAVRVMGIKWKVNLKSRWKSWVGVTSYLDSSWIHCDNIFLQLKVAVPGILTTVSFGLLVAYLLLNQTSGSLPAQIGGCYM